MESHDLGIDFLKIIFYFFFNDTATTEIYTLSLHDALPIYGVTGGVESLATKAFGFGLGGSPTGQTKYRWAEFGPSRLY